MEQLKPIELIHCMISKESIEKGTPIYTIEREFMAWVCLHADFFLQRYREGIGEHWTENEIANVRLGLCGQKAFELMLQLMEIPYVPNDPIIDQRLTKNYDFLIPKLGKIEVKCYKHYCKKVLIKPNEWHSNDYLVVWKFRSNQQDSLQMVGWQTKNEVELTPTTKKGATIYNPHSDAIIIDMSELRHPEEFITKLRQAKAQCM